MWLLNALNTCVSSNKQLWRPILKRDKRETWVHMRTNLVPEPSPPPTACTCILQATETGAGENLGMTLHPYHMPMYISLVPEPRYEATRTSYPPKQFLEHQACGRSLPHAEQVDPTGHNYTFWQQHMHINIFRSVAATGKLLILLFFLDMSLNCRCDVIVACWGEISDQISQSTTSGFQSSFTLVTKWALQRSQFAALITK